MKYILTLLLAVHAAWAQAAQTGTAAISGTVVDAKTQKAIPAALVVASRMGAPPFTKNTKSGADGAFQIRGLTAGDYLVCVQTSGDRYLNPCQWNGSPVGVRLHDGGDVVRAARKANPALEKIPSPPLSVILTDDTGVIRPVPFVASIGTSSEFSTVVPENTKFQLNVASLFFALGDTSGKQLVQNAFKESLSSPALTSALLELSPLGRPVGLRIPSRVFNFVATGLVAH